MKTELISTNEDLLVFSTELLEFQLLGGIKYSQLDALRVTMRIEKKDFNIFRHSLNLYNQKAVEQLLEMLSDRFSLEVKELDYLIAELTEQLESFRMQKLNYLTSPKTEAKELTDAEVKQAKQYLKRKDLMQRTNKDIGISGIVGEEINRLLMYMVFTSRKLKKPLHIVSLSPSGAGKTYLQEKVSELIPDEDKIEITSLSKNAFYYLEDIDKKLILIEDLTGAESSLYPIREIQSKGRLTKSITTRNAKGNPVTTHHVLEGKVTVSATGTKETLYTDNESRSIVIHLDGSERQDVAILEYQKKLASKKVNQKLELEIKHLLQNIQRVLKPVEVVNPFASHLELPKEVRKIRRTFGIYLSVMEVIAYYHQYQRKVQTSSAGTSYIEVEPEDIAWANKLLEEVLFRKTDELSAGIRKFLERLQNHLKQANKKSITSKEIRLSLQVPNGTLKRYLKKLVELEYLKVKGNRYKGFTYYLEEENTFESYGNKLSSQLQENYAKALMMQEGFSGKK
jgi:hypothetical protein